MHSVTCGPAGREEPTELMKTTQMLARANLIIPPALCFVLAWMFISYCLKKRKKRKEKERKILLDVWNFYDKGIRKCLSVPSSLSDELLQSCGKKSRVHLEIPRKWVNSHDKCKWSHTVRKSGWMSTKTNVSHTFAAFAATSSLPDTYEGSWGDMTDKRRRSDRKCETKKNSQ